MDPEDIALAQQAGFLGPQPPVVAPVGPSPYPEADPLGVDAAATRPNPFGELPPQLGEADLSFLPPLPGTEPAVPAPAPAPAPVSKSTSSSTATSSSSSERGFSPEKFQQVRKGPGGELRRDLAAIPGQVEQRYASAQTENTAIAGELEKAQKLDYDAQLGQLTEKGKYQEDLALIERNHMWKVKAAQENSALEAEAAMATHKAAVEDWAASSVNPGAVFDQAGGFNSFGMGAAAFMHDFLGAKGIKTSAMDTFNRAQELNIQAQVENIRKKGQVATAFGQLWENVRAQSATEMEAMTRLHGYSLRALEARFTADAGKYDSKLAQAKYIAGLQEIRKARLKNDMDLRVQVGKEVSDATKHRIDYYNTETSAAMAAASLASSERIAKADREARAALAQSTVVKEKRRIVDPFSNVERWEFKDGVTDGEIAKVTDKVSKYESTAKQVNDLRALIRTAGPVNDVTRNTRFSPEMQRKIAAKAQMIARSMIATMEDGRVSDADVQQVLKTLQNATSLTVGGVDTIVADTEAVLHEDMQAGMRQYVDDLAPGTGRSGPKNIINEKMARESRATSDNNFPKENDPTNPIGYTKWVLGSPDAFKGAKLDSASKILTLGGPDVDTDAVHGANASFGEFLASPDGDTWEKNIGKRRLGETGVLRGGVPLLKQKEAGYTRDSLGNQTADSAFVAMYSLAQLALKGQTGAIEELDKYAHLSELTPKEAEAVAGKALDAEERTLLDAYATFNRDMARQKLEAAKSYGPSVEPDDGAANGSW